jgi:hypothetical protein
MMNHRVRSVGALSGTVTSGSPMTANAAHVTGGLPRRIAASFAERAASATPCPLASAR